MARLNEVPASSESIESLKRRFVRQNREIARANSIQSVRIKTLEADVAKLLAENVSLREEIISLNHELEKYQGSERIDNTINSVKAALEAKLAEVSSIVSSLGNLRRGFQTTASLHISRGNADPAVSPTEFEGMSNLRSLTDTAVGGLPVIPEDKCYPRLSLGSDGAVDPTDDQGNGYETEDPIVSPQKQKLFNPPLRQNIFSANEQDHEDAAHIPESPPALEMRKRRKRRDSSLLKDIIPEPDIDPVHDIDMSPHLPKTGSKRKLSAREDEERVSLDCGSDDFQFTRVTERPTRVLRDTDFGDENASLEPKPKKVDQPPKKEKTKSVRRVLGPKSTNVDIKSPTKRGQTQGKPGSMKGEVSQKPQRMSKAVLSESFPNLGHEEPKTTEIQATEEPRTQQQDDEATKYDENLCSGTGEQLPQSKNTRPPESAVHISVNDGNQTARMRPSRRSRGAVSYAEPNLRDKMRRPTKELVDAVAGERYRRISKAYPVKGTSNEQDTNAHDNAHYQKTGQETNYMNDQGLPRRAKLDPSTSENAEQSASSLVISTLVAGTKKRAQTKRTSVAKPDISLEHHTAERESEDVGKVPQRQSRRHSTNPSQSGVDLQLPKDMSTYDELMNDSQGSLDLNMANIAGEGRRAQRHSTRRRTTMV